MSFQQLLIIFWARKGLIIAYLLVTMITTLTLSLLMPKQYVATTSLVLDQPSIDPITGEHIPIQVITSYMATQTDIINSPAVARSVVDSLDLKNDKVLQAAFQQDSMRGDFRKLEADFREWIAKGLMKKLNIIPSRESSILGISFSDKDPAFSAKAANAFAQAYIQMINELKRQPAQQTADWFDEQLKTLGKRRDVAQKELSNFQETHGIVATTNERIDLEDAKLTELSNQLVKNQLETSERLSKKKQLTETLLNPDSLKSLPEVLNSIVLQELKVNLARTEAKLADLAVHVDHNHPQYREALAEIANLKKQINAEMNTILHGFNSNILSSAQRDESLSKVIAIQKNRVLQLKKDHNEMETRKRELENAQLAYDTVMKRSIQMRMESNIRQSNVAVLDQAITPKEHDSPKIKLNMVISILLGTILGVGAALFAEIMDRRVRSPADIIEGLDLPVFGVIIASSRPSKKKFGVPS